MHVIGTQQRVLSVQDTAKDIRMKELIILRGLPGSGKSTRAKELATDESIICSADDFFIHNGIYRFDANRLHEAHETCFAKAKQAMILNTQTIIIDNTNTQKWEYQKYLDLAYMYGYEVDIEMIGNLTDIEIYHKRNTHNVPKEAIERMAKRFES